MARASTINPSILLLMERVGPILFYLAGKQPGKSFFAGKTLSFIGLLYTLYLVSSHLCYKCLTRLPCGKISWIIQSPVKWTTMKSYRLCTVLDGPLRVSVEQV